MIGGVPGFHDYVRDKAGPLGHCTACGYEGAMGKGMSGSECPQCHSMRLELRLRDGTVYRQFGGEPKSR